MATSSEVVEFILDKLGDRKVFTVRKMFGEYALYADGKTVALVCDDQLYVKIVPASSELNDICEQGDPYPGARAHFIVTEDQLDSVHNLPNILRDIARVLPEKKKKRSSLN